MTPERWQQIDHLLEAALNQLPELRAAFLDEVCAGDDISREEIESLISFRERAGSFLETPALDAVGDLLFEPGESLVGRMLGTYRIERQLGSGGMGEVYLAHDTRLDRNLAIKLLPFELDEGERATRLIREAKAVARLDHPNICAIHEVAEEDGLSFIVMQHVDGETLASRIECRPLDLSESLNVMAQVADALSEAHSRGIVHRDIKPQNIMITSRGQVKVLDFGLAKVVGAAEAPSGSAEPQSFWSAPGIIAGTAPYMSPEQATGSSVDTRSDIFSLGVVLYQCIAGSLPFSGDSPIDICNKVAHYSPPAPSQLSPNVPPELDRIVMKALAKDPSERYQSASDLSKDLRWSAGALSSEMPARRAGVSVLGWQLKTLRRPWAVAAMVLLSFAFALRIALPKWWPAAPHTPAPAARLLYQEGMDALRAGGYYTATKKFERAVQLDDDFALAHARLAESLAELDYLDRANRQWARVTGLLPDGAALAPVDVLYLEAINQTLIRNFARAVESYQQIVEAAQEPDKVHAYFDLGRAYEKTHEVEKALESYAKAAGQPPSNPAALLRAGILYRDGDVRRTVELFDSAERLYGSQQNEEGLAEVRYHRGLFHKDAGRLEEARNELDHALNKAKAAGNYYQQVRAMLALSGVIEEMGRWNDARDWAISAEAIAEQQGMENLPTQALIEIGDLLRSFGEYSLAEQYLKRACEYAEQRQGRTEARALLSLGRLYVEQHESKKAQPYIEEARQLYQEQGDAKGEWQALFQIANAKELAGEYEAAQQEYEEYLASARQSGDISRRAQLEEAIGFVLAHREAFSEALERFETAHDLFGSIHHDAAATNNLLNIADMLWRLGRYQEGGNKLLEASGRLTTPQLEAKNTRIEIQMALSERRFSLAARKDHPAVALNANTGHLAEVKAAVGLAWSFSGRRQLGVLYCEEAVKEVEKIGGWMLWGAQLALAETLLRSGDAKRALEAALEAEPNFERAGQRDSEWRAWLIAALASEQLRDYSNSRAYASRAGEILSALHRKWGDSYFNRPDVQANDRRLAWLLGAQR